MLVGANGQPASALYARSKKGGRWNAHSLQVLSMQSDGIAGLTMYMKPVALTILPAFHVPITLEDSASPWHAPARTDRSDEFVQGAHRALSETFRPGCHRTIAPRV